MISLKILFITFVCLKVTNAFEFLCKFGFHKEFHTYCCEAENLVIEEPHTKISNVVGTHLVDYKNADVKNLGINNQSVKFLPINIAEYFPNLRKLQVKLSELEYITKNDFLGMTQLTNIFLGHNNLKELPCGVFNTNTKLQQLHFEENYLEKIGSDIFKPLPHLRIVHFRLNECIDMDVELKKDVPKLLEKIPKKCSTSCEPSKSYTAIASSCDSEFYNNLINSLGSTVFDLETTNSDLISKLNATKVENNKLVKENENLNKNMIELGINQEPIIENLNNIEIVERFQEIETPINKTSLINQNLTTELESIKVENMNIQKENKKLIQEVKEISTKLNQTLEMTIKHNEAVEDAKTKKKINVLENTITNLNATNSNLTEDLNNRIEEYYKLEKEKEKIQDSLTVLESILNQTIELATTNQLGYRETTRKRNLEIKSLVLNITSLQNDWIVRCWNDDLNECYTNNSFVNTDISNYTNLRTFHEYKEDNEYRVENRQLNQLSNIFFKHYPFMEYFSVTDSGLQMISNGNFMGGWNLLQIDITGNDIKYIDESAFKGAEYVELINLKNNNIKSLPDRVFKDLNMLKEINLSNNQIEFLKENIFDNLAELEVLHMEYNNLNSLHVKLFQSNSILRRVYLNSNNLKYIHPKIFQNLKHLVYVNLLKNNCITKEYKSLNNTVRLAREINRRCHNRSK